MKTILILAQSYLLLSLIYKTYRYSRKYIRLHRATEDKGISERYLVKTSYKVIADDLSKKIFTIIPVMIIIMILIIIL